MVLRMPGRIYSPVQFAACIFLVFLIASGLVGCSLEPFSEDLDGEIKGLTVEGEVGIAPEVSMEGSHSNEIEFDVLVNGVGPKIASGSLVVANVTRYFWKPEDGVEEVYSSYGDEGVEVLIDEDNLRSYVPDGVDVPEFHKGSRIALISPEENGGSNVSIIDIMDQYKKMQTIKSETDFDENSNFPRVEQSEDSAPVIRVPAVDPPADLSVVPLVEGEGEGARVGDRVVVQFSGINWEGAEVFDSTWLSGGTPVSFVVGLESMVQAWEQALIGVSPGSRLIIIAPPEFAYGGQGNPSMGIDSDDTLVYLVDVLGVH